MKKMLIIFICALFSGVSAFALELEPDSDAYLDEGAPETSPYFHHYIYSITCLPDQNIYKIEPSGGAYQPKEWRTEAFEKLQQHRPKLPYGIIFNDKVLFQNKLFHVCVLKNGTSVQTDIDYEGETLFHKSAFAEKVLPFRAQIMVTVHSGNIFLRGGIRGGNRKSWEAKRSILIQGDVLTEQLVQVRFGKLFDESKEIILNETKK